LGFLNDTVLYYKSNTAAEINFGGIFVNTGIQYVFATKKGGSFTIGAYANLQQKLKGQQNRINETFEYDGNGGIYTIDTVDYKKDFEGTIKTPATYGVGFVYIDKSRRWQIGADFETTNWSSYRSYGEKDAVQNNWTMRTGAEYYPAKTSTASTKYWNFVKYRAGFYFGPDYIKINENRTNYAATLGASFPLTSAQRIRFGEYVLLNTAVEAGGRGNKQSFSLRENILRFSIGISMNARWFQKRSYE